MFKVGGYTYGWANNFCWVINPNQDENKWEENFTMLLIFQSGPMCIAFMVCLWCFLRQVYRLKNVEQDILKELDVKAINLFWYPLVFLLVGAPGIINMWLIYLKGEELRFLMFMHIALVHSIGFINWFVYGMLNMRGLAAPAPDPNSVIKKEKAKLEEFLIEKKGDESIKGTVKQLHLTNNNTSSGNNESSLVAELVRAQNESGR